MNTRLQQTENVQHPTLNFQLLKRRGASPPRFIKRLELSVKRLTFSPHRRAAFTLVEMLLVLVILAVLAAIVIPKFSGRSQQAKETAAKTQIGGFELALDAFEVDTGAYPAGSNSLGQLIDAPANAQGWKGPYLKTIPPDPWGNVYLYTYPGKNNASGYDLSSMGPDARSGTEDDINNWSQARK